MSSIISHMTVGTNDFAKSRVFYAQVLNCLGYKVTSEFEGLAGYGIEDNDSSFWISARSPVSEGLHYCFEAPTRKAVDAFHAQALELGAKDNGKPGLRKYEENYYAAYVIDPDGHYIEAVCLT